MVRSSACKEDLFHGAVKAYHARADAHLTECLSGPSARAGLETLLRTEVEMAAGPDGSPSTRSTAGPGNSS
jgi:hypothetical protein